MRGWICVGAAGALALVVCCGGVEERPAPVDLDGAELADPGMPPERRCGDGVCDEDIGEDEWWCIDCGYDPLTGGPMDGGTCGDGVCFGGETMTSCFTDCRPEAYNYDSGWPGPGPSPWPGPGPGPAPHY